MTAIKLRCPSCEYDRWLDIGPWQTAPGVYGALSLLCQTCNKLWVVELKDAYQINIRVKGD